MNEDAAEPATPWTLWASWPTPRRACSRLRICRGFSLYGSARTNAGLLLYHVVIKLRPLALNFLSLESVLAGVISQMPIQRITVMSTARSAVVATAKTRISPVVPMFRM